MRFPHGVLGNSRDSNAYTRGRKNYNKFTIATLAAYNVGVAFELEAKKRVPSNVRTKKLTARR